MARNAPGTGTAVRRLLAGLATVALLLGSLIGQAQPAQAATIVCTVRADNPHGSFHVPGTVNFVVKVTCAGGPVNYIVMGQALRLDGRTVTNNSCRSDFGKTVLQCNLATEQCRSGRSYEGLVNVSVDVPPNYIGPRQASDKKTAQVFCHRINAGDRLLPGEEMRSKNRLYSLVMQYDGNLVEYGPSGPLWSTCTNRKHRGVLAEMQHDANFVLYDGLYVGRHDAMWASGTRGPDGSYIELQDDGNLVIYAPGHIALWGSQTEGSC